MERETRFMPHPFSKLPVLLCFAVSMALFVTGCESKAPPADSADAAPAAAGDASDAPQTTTDEVADAEATANAGASDAEATGSSGGTPPPAAAEEMPENSSDVAEAAPAEVPPGADPLVPASAQRQTTEGWWRIVFGVNGNDYSAGFLQVVKDDAGNLSVAEIRTNDIVNPAMLVNSEATDETLQLFFEQDSDNQFDFAGSLQDNVIRGNLQFSSQRQILVRLVPIDEAQASDEALNEQVLGPTFGLQPIAMALQSEDPVSGIREVAETWNTSPVLYMAYDMLFLQAEQLELDRPTLEALATEFEAIGRLWGDRAEQAAKLNIAVDLMSTAYQAEFARAKLEEVREANPDLVEKWGEFLKMAERTVAIEEARTQLTEGDAEAGLAALRALHAEQVIDPIAAYRLAAAEQEHGSKEEALRLFSRLAAAPQVERELGEIASEVEYVRPRTAAARLYEEQHGNRDGFDEHLTAAYRDTLTSFLTDEARNRQPTASERMVLIELFTGAMCPPCVAADVATEAVSETFPASDAVVLRYHMNIPGPDPLSSTDSEVRSDYYEDEFLGTPTVFVDGTMATNVAGPYSNASSAYNNLSSIVEERAALPAGATIDLAATVEGHVLKIDANASGFEQPADTLRLRIGIAENAIEFEAPNGIRVHEMVVREMPGGATGIAAVNGEFSFQQEIALVETRDRLVSFLDDIESRMSQNAGQPFRFDKRPMDLRRLTVVAFLQDEATHEVLQTAVVPIEQDVELPALAARSSADPFSDVAADAESSDATEGPTFTAPED